LVAVHCHSAPYTSEASQDKVRRLVQTMAKYQGRIKLYMIPLTPAQQEIVALCGPSCRILLYRRFMLRLTEKIAAYEKSMAIVTGEAVGQVASQTLENMRAVSVATEMNVLRPLCGYDKDEIIDQAKKWNTFDISIEPHDDCCTYLMPRKPLTRARISDLDREEELLDVEFLVDECLAGQKCEMIYADGRSEKIETLISTESSSATQVLSGSASISEEPKQLEIQE
jgi:thiamine biosynthesis protein ThiI